VIGAETLSRMVDWTDRATCVLFGDAAGAVVLKASDEAGILSTHLHADGGKRRPAVQPGRRVEGLSRRPAQLRRQGHDGRQRGVQARGQGAGFGRRRDARANGLEKSDLDWLIPHQANLRIIEATAKRLQMSMDRVIVTVDRTGNTSAGSVPLALDEAIRSGKVKRGELLLLEAFGGGFTWGSALVRY
jgi:3-oxoacyl-[acyl-carrier-protein] synthase-3